MKSFTKMMMILAMVLCMAVPAIAQEFDPEADMYVTLFDDPQNGVWIDNMYDIRAYDASHPAANIAHSVSGWYIGLSFYGTDIAPQIDEVTLTGSNGTVAVITEPDIWSMFGQTIYMFDIQIGNEGLVADSYIVTAKNKAGNSIIWSFGDGTTSTAMTITPKKGMTLVPQSKIKRLVIMKNGELKVKFTAPYDTRSGHIRIRIFNEDVTGFAYQIRIDPPYEIVKKDGTIIPDMVKVFIPEEYTGLTGRIEYRTFEEDGYMSRGMTMFKLPELEEVE